MLDVETPFAVGINPKFLADLVAVTRTNDAVTLHMGLTNLKPMTAIGEQVSALLMPVRNPQ